MVSAGYIINAKGGTVVMSELKLGQVARQVLFGAVLIDTAHTALEDREIAFDGVGVRLAANKLAGRVLHRVMAGEVLGHLAVEPAFVGVQRSLGQYVLDHQLLHVLLGGLRNMEGADPAATLDQAEDGVLVAKAALPRCADGLAVWRWPK